MPFEKGKPKTGGRKKGSLNKATAARLAEIAVSGETPLEFMLRVMRDEVQLFDVRLDAAKSAAPYVHPKLAAIEHSGKLEVEVSEAEIDAEIAQLQAEVGGTAAEEAGLDGEGWEDQTDPISLEEGTEPDRPIHHG